MPSRANLLSIKGQTHEFIIYAMHQGARVDNLTIYYHKQIKVSFLSLCPVIGNEFCHNIAKVVWSADQLGYLPGIHSYIDNVMTEFMINNRTDSWKNRCQFVYCSFFMSTANNHTGQIYVTFKQGKHHMIIPLSFKKLKGTVRTNLS